MIDNNIGGKSIKRETSRTASTFLLPAGRSYLDSAATTPKPMAVVEAVVEWYRKYNANIHRGLYPQSIAATFAYEEVRKRIANFLNAPARNIIFTSGTTDSLNLVSWMLRERLKKGTEILVSPIEHHANLVPWQEAASATGARLIMGPLSPDGTLDIEGFLKLLNKKTRVVAVSHVSNVTGEVVPLNKIIPVAKKSGAFVVVDGAQAVPHLRVNLKELDCDAYAWSGHKAYGPTGTGVLYLKNLSLRPARTGGDMIDDVAEQEAIFAENEPRRFEAGTPNLAGIYGLGAAIAFLKERGMDNVWRHGEELLSQSWKRLEMLGVNLIGPKPEKGRFGRRAPIITFTLKAPVHDAAELLAECGVDIRAGMHCAHPLHKKLGLSGTIRASFGLFNTMEDVERLEAGVKKVMEVFR